MKWEGVNKAFGPTEIEPGASPDTVNTSQNVDGELIAREGKTQHSRPVVWGKALVIVPFIGPWGTYYIFSDVTGNIKIYTGTDETSGIAPNDTHLSDPNVGAPIEVTSGGTTTTDTPFFDGSTSDAATYRFFAIRTAKSQGVGADAYLTTTNGTGQFSSGPIGGAAQTRINMSQVVTGTATLKFGASIHADPFYARLIAPGMARGTVTGARMTVSHSGAGSSAFALYEAG